jgi:hypothetical protein
MVRSQLNPNRRSWRCAVLLFQQLQLRYSLEPEREQKKPAAFSQNQKPKLPITVIKKKKKKKTMKKRRRRGEL